MNKVCFLDRDGTINIDKGYVHKKEDFEFIDGAIKGMKMLQEAGYKIIIITNQSGIARGIYTKEQFEMLQEYMYKELEKYDIVIDKTYYCPHLGDCDCRKPKLKLFYDAINEFDIDINKSFAIGDKLRDLAICEKENIEGFLISDKNIETTRNITIVKNLYEASEIITNKCQ